MFTFAGFGIPDPVFLINGYTKHLDKIMHKTILGLIVLISTFQVFPQLDLKGFEPQRIGSEKGITKNLIDSNQPPVSFPEVWAYKDSMENSQAIPTTKITSYAFNNPAGCAAVAPQGQTSLEMLETVQAQLGDEIDLSARRMTYIWNGSQESYVDVSADAFVYEFEVNEFQFPFTYKSDFMVTIFIQNGFVVWLRSYNGIFRLLAIPVVPDVEQSIWNDYLEAYWKRDGKPHDKFIIPVSKKIPCHWMIDENHVTNDSVGEMFVLDWHIPDYLTAGRQYLAGSCRDAYRVSQEEIGYWDATSMCGPLTWQITDDANSFPYRIGSYDASADLFISANPRYWGTRPWVGFGPETYDLVVRTKEQMAGYDFDTKGNLYVGDILFSYGSPDQWSMGGGNFSHIFMVAGIDENNARLAITNMVKNHLGVKDCFISEVSLYTPGDRVEGVINHEWNNHGYGITGKYGFDVFRWKWITHSIEGQSREYEVRWGETIETIAFDWKVSPENIIKVNHFLKEVQLNPGQLITIPAPDVSNNEV